MAGFKFDNDSGVIYFNEVPILTGTELSDVIDDLTPELGGNLDALGNDISNIDTVTGAYGTATGSPTPTGGETDLGILFGTNVALGAHVLAFGVSGGNWGSGNVDHIWYDDSGLAGTSGTYYLVADSSYKSTTVKSGLVATRIVGNTLGSAGHPTFTWQSDLDTGIFSAGANAISITNAGTETFRFKSDGTLASLNGSYETLVIADDDIPNKKYVDDLAGLYLPLTGGTLSGNLIMGSGSDITGTGEILLTGSGVNRIANHRISPGLMELGWYGTTDRNCYIDFHTQGIDGGSPALDDYNARLIKYEPGSNSGVFRMQNSGEGPIEIYNSVSGEPIKFHTNAALRFSIEDNGTLHAETASYETLVTDDDDIPNKKYVDDAITTGAFTHPDPHLLGDGTAGAPTYSFSSDTDTGIYLASAGNMSFTSGGVRAMTVNGSLNLDMENHQIFDIDRVRANDGSATDPTFSFDDDLNTGIYSYAADELGFATGGTAAGRFTSTGILYVTNEIRVDTDGSASDPAYTFTNDTDIGMYRVGTNKLGFTTNGTEQFRIEDGVVRVPGTTQLRVERNTTQYVRLTSPGAGGNFVQGISPATNKKPLYIDNVYTAGSPQLGDPVILFRNGEEGSEVQRFRINVDGSLTTAQTTSYETLVTDDDDIPNKKYVDDAITTGLSGSGHMSDLSDDSTPQLGGDLDVDGNTITGLPDTPTTGSEATSKNYVDSVSAGLDPKESCRAASTANLSGTFTSGSPGGVGTTKAVGGTTLTVDGVSLANGDRLLLKDQTAALENGIYVVSGIGSSVVLTRATDFDDSPTNEVDGGEYTFVVEGTVNAGQGFVVISTLPVHMDNDDILWSQYSGGNQYLPLAGGTMAGDIDLDNNVLMTDGPSTTNFQWFGTTYVEPHIQANGTTPQDGSSISLFATTGTDSTSGYLFFGKASSGTAGIVADDELIGSIAFNGADGTNLLRSAVIRAYVDGTPSSGEVPGSIRFDTQAEGGSLAARMTIESNGTVSVQTSSYETLVTDDDDIPNKKYVDDAITTGTGSYLPLTGGTLTGDLTISASDADLFLTDTDSPTDNKTWRIRSNSSQFVISPVLDNLTASTHVVLSRSGNSLDTMTVQGSVVISDTLSLTSVGSAIHIDDSAQKRITWNDGGGNFNIRSGVYHSTSDKYVVAGDGAADIEMSSDGTDGRIVLQVATTGTNADDPVTYDNIFDVQTGITLSTQPVRVSTSGAQAENNPAFAFNGDSDTGMYWVSANALGFSTGGTNRMTIDSNGIVTLSNEIRGHSGTASDPGFTFGDDDNGMYLAGTNSIGFSTAATSRLIIEANGTLNVSGTTTYETLVTDDDDIPNKKYVDDEITAAVSHPDPHLLGNGAVGTPTYSFSGDTDTGVYLESSGIMAFANNGARVMRISTSAILPDQPIKHEDGTAADPSYTFLSDQDTGMYRSTTNLLGFAAAGQQRVLIGTAQMTVYDKLFVDNNTELGGTIGDTIEMLTINGENANTAHLIFELHRYATGTDWNSSEFRLRKRIDATDMSWVSFRGTGSGVSQSRFVIGHDSYGDIAEFVGDGEVIVNNKIVVEGGTDSAPAYSFIGDENTGMYRNGADEIAFTTGGARQFTIMSGTGQLWARDGSETAPTYTFRNDSNTGMYSSSAGNLSFTTDGSQRMRIRNDGSVSVTTTDYETLVTADDDIPNKKYVDDAISTGVGDYLPLAGGIMTGTITSTVNSFINSKVSGQKSWTLRHTTGDELIFTPSASVDGEDWDWGNSIYFYDDGDVLFQGQVRSVNGSAALPSYSFNTNDNTGMYLYTTGSPEVYSLAFAHEGVRKAKINSDGVTINADSNSATNYPLTIHNSSDNYGSSFGAYGISNRVYGASTVDFTFDFGDEVSWVINGTLRYLMQGAGDLDIFKAGEALTLYAETTGVAANTYFAFRESDGTLIGTIGDTSATASRLAITCSTGDVYVQSSNNQVRYLASSEHRFYNGGVETFTIQSDGTLSVDSITNYENLVTADDDIPNKKYVDDEIAAGLVHPDPHLLGNGAVGTPTYSFSGDTDTGMYHYTTDQIGFSCNGTLEMFIATGVVSMEENVLTNVNEIQVDDGSAADPSFTFSNDIDTGIYLATAGNLSFATGGNESARIVGNGKLRMGSGYSVSFPAYSFLSDTDTGMYSIGANQLGFAASGTQMMAIADATGTTIAEALVMGDGGSTMRHYVGGYSATHTADTIYELGRVNVTGNSTNQTIVGRVIGGTSGTVGITEFRIQIRSQTLPTVSIAFSSTQHNLGRIVDVHVYENPLVSGEVIIGFECVGASLQNSGWSLDIHERGVYNYFTQTTSLTAVDFSGSPTLIEHDETFTIINSSSTHYFNDGSETAPVLTFENDTNTGIYRPSADTLGFTTNGSEGMNLTSTGILNVENEVRVANGSASDPGFVFTGDENTGMYLDAVDVLGFATDGTERMTIDGNGIVTLSNEILVSGGGANDVSYGFTGDVDTGMYSGTANVLRFATDGTERLEIEANGTLNVGGTTNYEDLVTQDDDIPNKKYIDDVLGVSSVLKNRIINGNFLSWQDGITFSNVGNAEYFADIWKTVITNSAPGEFGIELDGTDAPTTENYGNTLKFSVDVADASLSGNDGYGFYCSIEGNTFIDSRWGYSAGRSVTLSFWVKSSVTGTYSIALTNPAESTSSYVEEYTVSSANTWEKKTITIAGPPVSGSPTTHWPFDSSPCVDVTFGLGAASGSTHATGTTGSWLTSHKYLSSSQVNFMSSTSNVFKIANIQFELGSNATNFEYRSAAIERLLTYRYYESSDGANGTIGWNADTTSASTYNGFMKYLVQKRIIPTVTLTNQSNSRFPVTPGSVNGNADGFYEARTANSTGAAGYFYSHWKADARLI